MKIEILPRDRVLEIDTDQWRRLAELSLFVNPFYEPWCLVPAIEWLQKEDEVYIVTAWENNQLIALFPIHVIKSKFGIAYLSLWQHLQCVICDPLCSDSSKLSKVFNYVLQKMNVSMMRIPTHSELSYGKKIDTSSVVFSSTRGAISNITDVKSHLDSLPSRVRLENKRIIKRLFKETNAIYSISNTSPNRSWMADYCQLEHLGWKKKVSGSILSTPEIEQYYQRIYNNSKDTGRMEFQGIFDGETLLAVSFRITSHNHAFEMKTSYNERYKKLYPGVVLEILNLIELSKSKFQFVDSSTSSDNHLINRLWPEQRNLASSQYFSRSLSGKLLKLLYRIKNRV